MWNSQPSSKQRWDPLRPSVWIQRLDLRALSVLTWALWSFPLAASIDKLRFVFFFFFFYTGGTSGKITGLIQQEDDNRGALEFLTKDYGLPKLLFPSEMMVSTRGSSLSQLLDDWLLCLMEADNRTPLVADLFTYNYYRKVIRKYFQQHVLVRWE